jgi:pimeloyl-ACP methyl ester carboxylesterase
VDTPTLMMIHGLVGSLRYFNPQARMPNIRVIAEDLLGYGGLADVPPERLTLAAQADRVAGRIDELPDEKMWLLGHSMGGAVAVLAADRRPERIRGIINVEGNLTEKDTFWSRKIAAKQLDEWETDYKRMQADAAGWLTRCGVALTPERVGWAEQILAYQPARTVYAMAQALLAETLGPAYLEVVRGLLERDVSMHLLAGEKSAGAWGVPDFVRTAAASYTEQPAVGHLMMLEDPDTFCKLVQSVVRGSGRV